MKRAKIAAALCAAFYCALLWAKPAAWYLWRSPSSDGFVCAQIAPGDDWEVMKGPFRDALCRKPGDPG